MQDEQEILRLDRKTLTVNLSQSCGFSLKPFLRDRQRPLDGLTICSLDIYGISAFKNMQLSLTG